MEKFKFTPEGVQQMNVYAYALSDVELRSLVHEVQTDFFGWMTKTFILEADQVEFMETLDPGFIFVISNQIAVTMSLRLPVRLVKPGKPEGAVIFGAKRGDAHNPIGTVGSPGEETEAEGEFVFTITY